MPPVCTGRVGAGATRPARAAAEPARVPGLRCGHAVVAHGPPRCCPPAPAPCGRTCPSAGHGVVVGVVLVLKRGQEAVGVDGGVELAWRLGSLPACGAPFGPDLQLRAPRPGQDHVRVLDLGAPRGRLGQQPAWALQLEVRVAGRLLGAEADAGLGARGQAQGCSHPSPTARAPRPWEAQADSSVPATAPASGRAGLRERTPTPLPPSL